MMAAGTFYKIPFIGPPMAMPTSRTMKSVRPTLNKEIISTSFVITELRLKLHQILWKILEGVILHPFILKNTTT
jgi:hypothetical protein